MLVNVQKNPFIEKAVESLERLRDDNFIEKGLTDDVMGYLRAAQDWNIAQSAAHQVIEAKAAGRLQ